MKDSGIGGPAGLIPGYNPKTAVIAVAGGIVAGWIIGLAATYVALVYVVGD